MLKVFIYGPYHFNDYDLLEKKCNKLLENFKDIQILLFTCSIAYIDDIITKYAKSKGYPISKVNGIDIAIEDADIIIIFSNGFSIETREILTKLKTIETPSRIITYKDDII